MHAKRIPGALGAWLLAACAGTPVLAAENSCLACHKDPDFFVRVPMLSSYYRDWQSSPHSLAGLTCDQCHGGQPTASDVKAAHEGVLPMTDPLSPLYYRNQPVTCGVCHADKRLQFSQSKHYGALMERTTAAPTCTTCHRAMSRKPYYQTMVRDACRTCHNEDNVERIPLVSDLAEELLHRLNIAKGYLGWTRLHFESTGWPGETRREVQELSSNYEEIVSNVHRFDLAGSTQESADLLARLKAIFQRVWERPDEIPSSTDPGQG